MESIKNVKDSRQAIETKYFGPTNTLGARISAKYAGGSMVMPWDHELDISQNHAKAAQLLISKLGWGECNDYVMGSLPGRGYCFVAINKGVLK